jgi:tetratricopeptide (TPR) repeat protein
LPLIICGALVLAAVVTYEPLRHNDFILFDDNAYITNNPDISKGLTFESIIWAFKAPRVGFWHPLTIISHMLDCELFGQRPFWHHLVSLLFHITNTLLLFLILKNMTGALWQSAFVAAAFALHPLHVESVAWAAQRKDVLSTLFWLLTMAAYVHYVRRNTSSRYLLTLLLFVLGLMAKPMLVTLPFVLLLLDYWPLQRMTLNTSTNRRRLIANLIREKLPFFALSAIASLIALYAEESHGAIFLRLPFYIRLSNAFVSYAAYIGKMIWPARLAVLYPHPGLNLPLWQVFAGFLTIAVVSIWIFRLGRRYKYLPVGWLWYLGTLVPVIGLVQVSMHALADRYTYVPLIGLFIIIAWGSADLLAGRRYRKIVLSLSASAVLLSLSVCTRIQLGYWRDSLALFSHNLDVTKNNYLMHYNYGIALSKKGLFSQAAAQFTEAIRIKSDFPKAHNNLGLALVEQGNLDEAIVYFKKASQLDPENDNALYNLGLAYAKKAQLEKAVEYLGKSLKLNPGDPYTMINLASVLIMDKDSPVYNSNKALRLAERACELTGRKNPQMLGILKMAKNAAASKTDSEPDGASLRR